MLAKPRSTVSVSQNPRTGRARNWGRVLVTCAVLTVVTELLLASVGVSREQRSWRIAYEREGSIYLAAPDGTGETGITWGTFPTWSPDSRLIAFFRGHDLYVVQPDGSGLQKLASEVLAPNVWAPQWSPDGQRIFYYEDAETIDGAYIIPEHRCVDTLGRAVSIDFDYVIVTGPMESAKKGVFDIYLRRAGKDVRLTRLEEKSLNWPSLALDGTRVIFTCKKNVYVAATDGSGAEKLTNTGKDGRAMFAPDSSKIVFQREDSVYLMSANSSNWVRILRGSNPSTSGWIDVQRSGGLR